jgi:hypothetical protein
MRETVSSKDEEEGEMEDLMRERADSFLKSNMP